MDLLIDWLGQSHTVLSRLISWFLSFRVLPTSASPVAAATGLFGSKKKKKKKKINWEKIETMEKQLLLQQELPVQWALWLGVMFSSLSVTLFEKHFFYLILKIWSFQTMIPSELIGWGPNWQVLDPPCTFLSQLCSKAWNTVIWARARDRELGRASCPTANQQISD
jgi:hypothetical protein